MTRVVIVQEYVPAYRVPFFRELRRSAAGFNLDVVVAAGYPNVSQAARDDAVSIESLRTISQREWRAFGRRLTLRDIEPVTQDADFVVLEQARRNVDVYWTLARRRRPRPTALWGHGRDYTHTSGTIDRVAYNWLTRRADWFFAYTEGGKESVTALGYPQDRITVVENSIDTTALTSAIDEIAAGEITGYARAHGLRGKTALFIGGLDSSKRLPLLLDAAHRVAETDPGFRLLIAGAGAHSSLIVDSVERAPWLEYIGPVSGHDKALALASAQVIAMPGRVGLVAVDSFAAGTPIVTTNWPWHAPEFEYLRDGVNSVVSPDSVEDYASELRAILNDPPRLARLSEAAARERYQYTVDNMARRYLDGILRWREDPVQT